MSPQIPGTYIRGAQLSIRSHVPPSPTKEFNYCFTSIGREERERLFQERRELSPLQLCLQHPPLEGGQVGCTDLRLEIIDTIRVGSPHPAQIVTAQIESITNRKPVVAKFYDPLCADHQQDDLDPFRYADYQYSRESAAYVELHALQGSTVPRFYGSYTCELPTGLGTCRSVRLILMQHIQGTCLSAFGSDVKSVLGRPARQNIMKKVVEAESYAYAHGVDHGDTAPRNFMLVSNDSSDLTDPDLGVVLLDFGNALFKSEYYPFTRGHTEGAVSPILRWHAQQERFSDFHYHGWIDWEWQPWLESCWANSPRFDPITRDKFFWWVRQEPEASSSYISNLPSQRERQSEQILSGV